MARCRIAPSELSQLPELEAELGRVRETIDLLMTPEREARQKRLNELKINEKGILAKVAVLTERKNNFELTTRPERGRTGAGAARLSGCAAGGRS